MPYAANGVIASDSFLGAIEITDEQYAEALKGMCEGLVVRVDDGFKVALPEIAAPPKDASPSLESLAIDAATERDRLLAQAAIRIAPLQYAIDLGKATPEETALLNEWKLYCVDLGRVELQEKYPQLINWPSTPGAAAR